MAGWPWNSASRQDLDDIRIRLRTLEGSQQPQGSRWGKLTSILGVLGFVVSAVTVPILWNQNALLADQLDVQRRALEISGSKLKGEAQVVENVPGRGLFEPGTGGIERMLRDGEVADRDEVWVRIEVTNSGLSIGAIESAGLIVGDSYLAAEAIYCGIQNDQYDSWREECDMPLKVGSAEKEIFIFDIPSVDCGAFDGSPRKITAYFISVTGTVETIETEVLTSLESYCPSSE